MSYNNLREFIERLEREGELVRVAAEVSPAEEIAELTDRMAKQPGGGKALLFERTGTDFPVATNLMGSERRMALALGVESLDGLTRRIDALLREVTTPKATLWEKLRMLPLLGEMARWMPRSRRGRGPCQEVVLRGEAARLSLLPVLKCWPEDGGRFVTLPMVHTLDPDTGVRNVGMYRMQVFDDRTTGMHWHVHKTGARHYDGYRRQGRRMPVAVALGGDPVYAYAATAPMPDNMDEYLLAGFLRRRPVELVRCLTCGIEVPADCDFVIEGYVDPAEEKTVEGPFGDHTGFYSLEDRYPRFHVTAITHRRDAVYPATVVGVPPEEDAYIAEATERIFLAPIRLAVQPEVLLLGGLTGLFMILVARPAAVFLSLLPFRKFTTRARLYVSWVGLRGAVPIIFATYPVVAGVEDSSLLFNIVFFVTLLSLVVQGTTVSLMAEWLGLAYPERERIFNDEVMNRMLDDATTELTVTEAMLEPGHHLRDIVLPAATLVVMVARDGTFFVPKGNSVLRVGDKLLVVTENKSEVKSVVQPQE